MRQTLEPRLRRLLAMLCVALSVVFAGAAATGVVDRVQHSANAAHEHGAYLGFSIAADDHRAADHHGGDDHADGDDHDDDGAPSDHQPGASHHHHADSPVGALSGEIETGLAPSPSPLVLRIEGAANTKGIRPGGLERPPKGFATLS